MARFFRLWEKKRGDRRTGSPLVASVSEALYSAALLLLGVCGAAALVTSQVLVVEWLPILLSAWTFWLGVLVATALILNGGSGLIFAVLHAGTTEERRRALAQKAVELPLLQPELAPDRQFPAVPSDVDFRNSPGITLRYRLPSEAKTAWRLVAITVFTLVWCTVSTVLGVVAIQSHTRLGQPDWFLTWTALLFVAASVVAVTTFFRQLMLTTGIGPTTVEISDHPLLPGRSYEIHVSQAGQMHVASFAVSLVCEEIATFHQGTDVRTETARVWEQPLFRHENFDIRPNVPCGYSSPLEIPANAMHSFQSEHNRVQWKLVVEAQLSYWPPFVRSFPLVVHPNPVAEGSAR